MPVFQALSEVKKKKEFHKCWYRINKNFILHLADRKDATLRVSGFRTQKSSLLLGAVLETHNATVYWVFISFCSRNLEEFSVSYQAT
jgi:hypothetical protein